MPTVKDILDKKGVKVVAVAADNTVHEAAKRMNEHRIGAVVVVSGEKVIGIFSERDVLNRVVAAQKDAASIKVKEVMTSPVACCKLSSKLSECEMVMTQKKIRHLPVVEDGKLCGMISAGDVLAWRSASQESTIEYLNQYLYGRV